MFNAPKYRIDFYPHYLGRPRVISTKDRINIQKTVYYAKDDLAYKLLKIKFFLLTFIYPCALLEIYELSEAGYSLTTEVDYLFNKVYTYSK